MRSAENRILMIGVMALVMLGCSSQSALDAGSTIMRFELNESSEATRAAILALIPKGSSVLAAKTIMEANGFRCSLIDATTREPKSLYCVAERAKDPWVASKWQVLFAYNDFGVSEVSVTFAYVGP